MVLGTLDSHTQKDETGLLNYTIHKINSKWTKTFFFLIFPLYSKGIKLSLHVYITVTFFSPPFLLLQHEYLDKVLNATQQDLLVNLFFFFFLLFLWAAPAAYGGSQARGLIGAVATSLARATATQDPSRVCDLHNSSQQRRILNPLSKGRDRTRNLMVPSRIR